MKSKIIFIACITALICIAFLSCKKSSSDSSQLQVKMTDAPAAYDEVNVEVQSVLVKFSHDTSSWVTMQTNAGVYNLLKLQNGVDTLLAQGTFNSTDTVQQVRLVLGANNTIKVSGQTYPLTVPSGAESGLKIMVNQKLNASLTTLVLDFNADLSVNIGVQGYFLMPVISLK